MAHSYHHHFLWLLGVLGALAGCSYDPPATKPESQTQKRLSQLEEDRLNEDILKAQDEEIMAREIKQRNPQFDLSENPINYSYDNKRYHFANVQALRANIRRRIDSIQAAGITITFDTIVTRSHGEIHSTDKQ